MFKGSCEVYSLGTRLEVFLMLFICLFDLSCSGSRKNDNLWKSLGGIMGQSVEKPRGYNGEWSP